jgi:hypothetical protein
MIHPQTTTVLMLLWKAQIPKVGQPNGSEIDYPLHRDVGAVRAFRILSATQATSEPTLARTPPAVRRRRPIGIVGTERARRPSCPERRPARSRR